MNSVFLHEIMDCLVETLEAKDAYTKGHSSRVADMACDFARELLLSDEEYDILHLAAHLHDIGKIGIPDHILNKKTKLEEDEWEAVKQHPLIGYNILQKSASLEEIGKIVLHHHERYDGKGYPEGLAGKDIPLASRIICICDSIDAMVSDRPYRKALSWDVCKWEIQANKGLQFDPELVDSINDLWAYWCQTDKKIHTKYQII